MDKTIMKGSNVSHIKTVGTDTYNFFSRVDGYFAVMKVDETETTFEWYVGKDPAVGDNNTTSEYDAVYADPTIVSYAIPAKLSKSQKRLIMNANKGWDQLSRRDFE